MRKSLTLLFLLLVSVLASAQVDKKDVRRGNRQFAKAKYGDADISYRKGLNADSTSVASRRSACTGTTSTGSSRECVAAPHEVASAAAATKGLAYLNNAFICAALYLKNSVEVKEGARFVRIQNSRFHSVIPRSSRGLRRGTTRPRRGWARRADGPRARGTLSPRPPRRSAGTP